MYQKNTEPKYFQNGIIKKFHVKLNLYNYSLIAMGKYQTSINLRMFGINPCRFKNIINIL
ncbi:hypothetical protein DN403_30480 [Bacillus sp. AY2-1]|nr:hypothetical protein DN403_30480 [Bacillus sp. AY2-1]